jgi:hypothetical protein
MDYNGILKVVKAENPELTHKQAQKKASEMLKKFNAAQAESGLVKPGVGVLKADEPLPPGVVSRDMLAAAEARIRELGVNIHSITRTGLEFMPSGAIEKHGMNGVNTMVTFEDLHGNRLPVEGYFFIWI